MSTHKSVRYLVGGAAAAVLLLGIVAVSYNTEQPVSEQVRVSQDTPPVDDVVVSVESVSVAPEVVASVPSTVAGAEVAEEAPVMEPKPSDLNPDFHVFLDDLHKNHPYTDTEQYSTETLKVYAQNGDALAALLVGARVYRADPAEGANYFKLSAMLSGKAGPLDMLAKRHSSGSVEDIEMYYLLGYATASIGYYDEYPEMVPRVERMVRTRYLRRAREDPQFSVEQAMQSLRMRRASLVEELNRSPLIDIDDSIDYPGLGDDAAQEGE